MENAFSELDLVIIEREVTKKSYSDIAFLLDRPIEQVSSFITEFLLGKEITSFQQLKDQRKASRAPAARQAREKKAKEKKPLVISRKIIPDRNFKLNRAGEKVFTSKVIDLSQLQEVRIDSKTCIYIKPGQDPNEEKNKYLKRLADCKSRYLDQEKSTKNVSKFKPAV